MEYEEWLRRERELDEMDRTSRLLHTINRWLEGLIYRVHMRNARKAREIDKRLREARGE